MTILTLCASEAPLGNSVPHRTKFRLVKFSGCGNSPFKILGGLISFSLPTPRQGGAKHFDNQGHFFTLQYVLFGMKGPEFDADLLKYEEKKPTKKKHKIDESSACESGESSGDGASLGRVMIRSHYRLRAF